MAYYSVIVLLILIIGSGYLNLHQMESDTIQVMSKYVGESAETVRKIVKEVSDGTLIVTGFDSWENQNPQES